MKCGVSSVADICKLLSTDLSTWSMIYRKWRWANVNEVRALTFLIFITYSTLYNRLHPSFVESGGLPILMKLVKAGRQEGKVNDLKVKIKCNFKLLIIQNS